MFNYPGKFTLGPVNENIQTYSFFMILVSAIHEKQKVICHPSDFPDVKVSSQLSFVAC